MAGVSPVGALAVGPSVTGRLWMLPPEPRVPAVVPLSSPSVFEAAGSGVLAPSNGVPVPPVLDWYENSLPPVLKLAAATSTM